MHRTFGLLQQTENRTKLSGSHVLVHSMELQILAHKRHEAQPHLSTWYRWLNRWAVEPCSLLDLDLRSFMEGENWISWGICELDYKEMRSGIIIKWSWCVHRVLVMRHYPQTGTTWSRGLSLQWASKIYHSSCHIFWGESRLIAFCLTAQHQRSHT